MRLELRHRATTIEEDTPLEYKVENTQDFWADHWPEWTVESSPSTLQLQRHFRIVLCCT